MLQVMPDAAFDPAGEWQDLEDRSSARLRPEDREFHARSKTLFPQRAGLAGPSIRAGSSRPPSR